MSVDCLKRRRYAALVGLGRPRCPALTRWGRSTARSTTRTMLSKNTARMGDEGKAVKRGSADGFAVCAAKVR